MGALARPDGAADRFARRQGRARAWRAVGRLERLLRAAHGGRPASARSTSASCPAAGGLNARRDGGGRRARCRCSCSAPTRSTSRPAPSSSISAPTATAARIAPTSSCRAPPIRRNPASTSTPRAACRWPARASFPPGDAREDWAILRALSDVLGQQAALRLAGAAAPGAVQGASASAAHRPDHARRPRRRRARWPSLGGTPDKAPFRSRDRGLLSHQSDRARLGGHGRMLGARRGQRGARPRRSRATAWPNSGRATSGR